MSLKKIEDLISKFGIVLTGARNGDVLVGAMLSTKHAVIKVHGDIKPQIKQLNIVRQDLELWDQFKIKLKSITFFESIIDLDKWFDDNANSDIYISNEVEFINLGALSDKITQESASELVSGLWSINEIESKFPRKPGSKAQHNTLVMHKDFWKISLDHTIAKNYDGVVLRINPIKQPRNDIFNLLNKLNKEHLLKCIESIKDNKEIIIIKNAINSKDIGFEICKTKFNLTNENIINLFQEEYSINKDDIFYFQYSMRNLTPAAYKSLIQKLIRYQAINVKFKDRIIRTEIILILAMGFLVVNPGSFVPDIQRFVTGIESATKRLAVIALEDSCVDFESIYHLLLCALVSQRLKWQPSRQLIVGWINTGIKLLSNKTLYKYDSVKGAKQARILFNNDDDIIIKCSSIIDELKSFSGDLGMFRNLAHRVRHNKSVIITEEKYNRPENMDFEHFVDQHWTPGLALFFDHKDKDGGGNRSLPFEGFFKKLWKNSSSYNPRKLDSDTKMIKYREAQKNLLLSLQSERKERKFSKGSFNTSYIISESWLAALVGVIEVNSPVSSYVTLNSSKPYEYIAIRRPSRDMDETPLDEETQESVIENAIEMLKNGVKLNKANAPFPIIKNAILYLREGEYVIKTHDKKYYKWEDLLTLDLKFKLLIPIEFSVENALSTRSDNGVSENWKNLFDDLINGLDIKIIRRILVYLVGFKSEFEINRISREGGSINHQVVIEDPAVFKFFLELSMIFPAALYPKEGKVGVFESPNPPLLWKLRDTITSKVEKLNVEAENLWPDIKDLKNRKLWSHQKYIFEQMKVSQNRGHFMWLKVGMGKTLIVMKYIEWLYKHNKLPKYIIYTLPRSALKAVIKEISYFNLGINLQIPTQTAKVDEDIRKTKGIKINIGSCKPEPYTITMISSDNHLRLCSDELLDIISDSLFIIDEVHKTLNDTQRSSVAIQLSNLAKEFIAFTGTPVIDQHTYKLIWWLEQIVPFEVNEQNFWVSANSMITKLADTNIPVEHQIIKADIIDNEYYNLVPVSLGGKNFRPSIEDIKKATEISYNSCDIEIINQALMYLYKGVVIVAKTKTHQAVLYELLVSNGVSSDSILNMEDSVDLLPDDNENSGIKVVIVPIQKSEGYNLTKMSVMISGVYPSNQASRTQIEGRINRIGQHAPSLLYITVHSGILTRVLKDHGKARSLNAALESIHKKL